MDAKTNAWLAQIRDELRTKKVLMLSLGAGIRKEPEKGTEKKQELSYEQKIEMIEKKLQPYAPTTYLFDGNKKEAAFVAEPLTEAFAPDEIVIIGTSRSAWTAFYKAFGDGNTDNLIRLFDSEQTGGKDIDERGVKERADTIEQIYRQGIKAPAFQGRRMHIIVTRYGMNREELLENYRLISEKMASVMGDGDMKYEVAFDITHSFRSMPVYNLVILNYLQNVIKTELKITHIYYGNLEVKSENNQMAPIIDLDELINVLNLSNSVNEFKNTGNVKSLLDVMSDSKLKAALEKFDWATQMNDYAQIRRSLGGLVKVLRETDENSSDKYVDLQKMILHVLNDKYFDDLKNLTPEIVEKMLSAEMQYRLSKWYYRQNRYGQALATGLEALRSYLVPMYLTYVNAPVCEANEGDENYRKAAMNRLKNVARDLQKKKLPVVEGEEGATEILCELANIVKKAVPLRNTFAHNLDGSTSSDKKQAASEKKQRELVDTFFSVFDRFVFYMQKNSAVMCQVYIKTAN